MAKRQQDVTLRLSAKGKEDLITALKSIGEEGERAAKKLEAGTRPANKGLKALDEGAKGAKQQIEGLVDRAGPAGDVLRSMGKGGFAAAAGIGAMVAALGAGLVIAKQALAEFDRIGKAADNLALSTDAYQALTFAAAEQGVTESQLETGTRALIERTSQLTKAQGELYSRLKDTHPELIKQLAAAKDTDARFRLVTDAIKGAGTETERNTIAYAAFGEVGLDVARVLERQEDGFDGMIARMKELGVVMDEDVIRRAEEMQGEFDLAAKVMDIQLKAAFVDLAPILIDSAKLAANVAGAVRDIADAFKDIDSLSNRSVLKREQQLFDRLSKAGVDAKQLEAVRAGNAELDEKDVPFFQSAFLFRRENRDKTVQDFNDLAPRRAQAGQAAASKSFAARVRGFTDEELEAELEASAQTLVSFEGDLAKRLEAVRSEGGLLTPIVEAAIRGELAQSEAALRETSRVLQEEQNRRAAVSAVRIVTGDDGTKKDNRATAARILLEQNDASLAIVLATEKINALEAEGLLTKEQAKLAIEAASEELFARTPMMKELDALNKEINQTNEELNEAYKKGNDLIDARALKAEALFAAELRQFQAANATPEQSRDNALAGLSRFQRSAAGRGVELDPEAVARATAAIEENYQRAREAASEFAETQYVIEDTLWGLIDGSEDFGSAWKRIMKEALFDALGLEDSVKSLSRAIRDVFDQMLSGGEGGGFFSQVFSAVLGGFGGGGNNPSGVPPIVPVKHSGGPGSSSNQYTRLTPNRVSSDEQLTLIRNDETVMTADQMGAMGGGGPQMVFYNDFTGADPSTQDFLMQRLDMMERTLERQFKSERRRVQSHIADDNLRSGRL